MTLLNLQHLSRPEAFQTTISKKVRAKALEIASELKGDILDVGCGNGIFLLEWSAKAGSETRLFGLDHDVQALQEARLVFYDNDLSADRFVLGDAFHLPFPDETFDAVFCMNTLINIYPFSRIESLLTELHRVCKKGGVVIFEYRNRLNPVLKSWYLYNSITGRLTVHAHCWSDFSHLRTSLGVKKAHELPIGSKIPIFSLSFMTIWEK